jgi:hypothetical protein
MPFDRDRIGRVRDALAPCWTPYREAAARAADEVAALLREAKTAAEPTPAFAAALGVLGERYLDAARLAPLFGPAELVPAGPPLEAVAAAGQVLREAAAGSADGVIELPPNGDLAASVERGLARIGRAFGAAHVVALARTGRYDQALHASWLTWYGFSAWNRRERMLAPPLVVALDGIDLRAGGLAELLDGSVRLALLVRDGMAPPAPLVRLLSPGAFVAQTRAGDGIDRMAAWSGPGVVAWVPDTSAAFVHDPAGGPSLASRLRVTDLPPPPRRSLGGLSVAQLTEELAQLQALAGLRDAAPTPAGASEEPVDRLAAWILSQADLSGAAAEAGG